MRSWILLVVLWAGPALAGAVDPGFYHRLHQVERWQQAGDYRKAIARLRRLQTQARSGLERALVQTYRAYAWLGLDRLDDAAGAARAALAYPKLPKDLRVSLYRLLGQVEIQRGRFREAAIWLARYLNATKTPEPQFRYLAAYAEYRLGRYRRAIAQLRAALQARPNPPDAWYQLLLACYLETRQYHRAETVFRDLLRRHPGKVRWWRQLAVLYLQQERYHHALAALVLAWHAGRLPRQELLAIVHLYAQVGIPEKAARLVRRWRREGKLPDDAKTRKLEAALWRAAREWDEARVVLAQSHKPQRHKSADGGRVRNSTASLPDKP